MNANKVILNGATILDLTQDGTEESNVGAGVKFHKPSGQPSVGTAVFGGGSGESGVPITIEAEAEMTSVLETAEIGSVYKYIGESTDTYESGGLYIVEAVTE
jgi:hypothetical protein